jgi:hypothetical protein
MGGGGIVRRLLRQDDAAANLKALSSQSAQALIATRTTTHKYDLYDPKRRGR